MDNSSGVGVLDKAALVLAALEPGPATLAGLVAATFNGVTALLDDFNCLKQRHPRERN